MLKCITMSIVCFGFNASTNSDWVSDIIEIQFITKKNIPFTMIYLVWMLKYNDIKII